MQQVVGRGLYHFLSSGGGKALGLALVVVIAGIFRFGKELLALFTSGSTGQPERG